MATRGSAAYLLIALAGVMLIGWFLFTLIEPFMSTIMASQLFTPETPVGQQGKNMLVGFWTWIWIPFLFAILYTGIVRSRRPTP